MPKPNKTQAQKLLETMNTKIIELQNEIDSMESKKKCPFWHEFAAGTSLNACLYITGNHKCDDLEICPSNDDAWCNKQIESSFKEDEKSEIIDKFKELLDKYADLRCDKCDMCEH